MIKVEWLYWLCAAFFVVVSSVRLTDRSDAKRIGSAIFWIVLAFAFAFGGLVHRGGTYAFIEGIAVISLAVMAGCGLPGKAGVDRTTDDGERTRSAERFGNTLFIPALLIPLVAAVFAVMGLRKMHIGSQLVLESGMGTVIGLGIAAIVALLVALALFKPASPAVPLVEGDRLLGHIGWAVLLPQFLATLGLLFNQAGVGKAVGTVAKNVLPEHSLLAAVIVYCLGMALFTVIMGNAFAAFPVMTAAVGWPVLVQTFHGDPAPVFAIGMLAGFCGTLCTPMAANFNLVPAALLELEDEYGPIKAQAPTAAILLVCNIVLMYVCCF